MAAAAKPKARVVSEVCTLCGLDWHLHDKEPTAEGCVKLLLDEVRSLNRALAARPYRPLAPVMPYVPSYPQPWRPYWSTTWQSGNNLTTGNQSGPQAMTLALSSGI